MKLIKTILVCRVQVQSETYYLCQSYPGGITLDGEVYAPYITSFTNAEKVGNFGSGSEYGSARISIMNGESRLQGPYIFNITNAWNNRTCEIRRADIDTATTWAGCERVYKGIIKNVVFKPDRIEFDVDDHDCHDDVELPLYRPEDVVGALGHANTDIPSRSVGARIPMQFGDLTDTAAGTFGKALLITNRIGQQQFRLDCYPLHEFNSIGMWENGLRRYFTGRHRELVDGKWHGEYMIGNSGNYIVNMKIDTAATVADTIGETDGINTITVSNYTKIMWNDEDTTNNCVPGVIGANILGIDNELMLIVSKPESNLIEVERGYNGTTVTAHSVGTPVYSCATHSSKNMLTFRERFRAITLQNIYTASINHASVRTRIPARLLVSGGAFRNVVDGNPDTYLKLGFVYTPPGMLRYYWIMNFDVSFGKVEDSFSVYHVYSGVKATAYCEQITAIPPQPDEINLHMLATAFGLFFINDFDVSYDTLQGPAGGHDDNFLNFVTARTLVSSDTLSVDQTNEVKLDNLNQPIGFGYSLPRGYIQDVTKEYNYASTDDFGITDLTNLNKRFKVHLHFGFDPYGTVVQGAQYATELYVYEIGLWLDMFADFTKRRTVCSCIGRKPPMGLYTSVFGVGAGALPEYMTNPVDAIGAVLYNDLAVQSTSFDAESWRSARSYYENFPISIESNPTIALSYGIDETMPGWDWLQWLARQFNLSLIRRYDGAVRILNLHKLQNTDETYGYESLPSYVIPMDTILFVTGARCIQVEQTGTDLLKNNIEIRYRRNNSTDEWQAVYPDADDVPDEYVLPESGITLSTARTKYYEGKKTELLQIDAAAIYNKTDARRLWEWNINDKSEIFFVVTAKLPTEHYSIINEKTEQYEVGDIVHFDGRYAGVVFNSSHRFVIRKTQFTDNAREIEIVARSIQPISEFTSTAAGQNVTWQNTPEGDDVYEDEPTSDEVVQNKI